MTRILTLFSGHQEHLSRGQPGHGILDPLNCVLTLPFHYFFSFLCLNIKDFCTQRKFREEYHRHPGTPNKDQTVYLFAIFASYLCLKKVLQVCWMLPVALHLQVKFTQCHGHCVPLCHPRGNHHPQVALYP